MPSIGGKQHVLRRAEDADAEPVSSACERRHSLIEFGMLRRSVRCLPAVGGGDPRRFPAPPSGHPKLWVARSAAGRKRVPVPCPPSNSASKATIGSTSSIAGIFAPPRCHENWDAPRVSGRIRFPGRACFRGFGCRPHSAFRGGAQTRLRGSAWSGSAAAGETRERRSPPLTIRRVPRRGQGPARAAECGPASPESAQQSPAPTGAVIRPGLFERPLNSTAPRERKRQDETGQARVLPNAQESARCLPTPRGGRDGAGPEFAEAGKAPAAPEAARRAEFPERRPTRAASRRSCPR